MDRIEKGEGGALQPGKILANNAQIWPVSPGHALTRSADSQPGLVTQI